MTYRFTPEDKKLIADIALGLLHVEAAKGKPRVSRFHLATDIGEYLREHENVGPRTPGGLSQLVEYRYGYADAIDEAKLERILARDQRFVVEDVPHYSGRRRGRAVYFILTSELAAVRAAEQEEADRRGREKAIDVEVGGWLDDYLNHATGLRHVNGEQVRIGAVHDGDQIIIDAETDTDKRRYAIKLDRLRYGGGVQ